MSWICLFCKVGEKSHLSLNHQNYLCAGSISFQVALLLFHLTFLHNRVPVRKFSSQKVTHRKLCRLFQFLGWVFPPCWKGSKWGSLGLPLGLLTREQEWSIQLNIPGSGIQTQAGPFVSKVLVDWSANESIRKLLAAEILSQRRVVHSLRKPSEGHTRINLSWLWPL